MALRNCRFIFDPHDRRMHFGGSSIDDGTHAEEYSKATGGKAGRRFDDCARGWVCGKWRGYPYGILHFAPPIRSESGDQALDVAMQALKHFIGMGAHAKTILRGFTALGGPWEQPLGSALPELFPKRRKAKAVVEAILQEVYSWEIGAVKDYLGGPRKHDHYSVWDSFAEWAENDDERLEAISRASGERVTGADEVRELEPDVFEKLPKEMQEEFNAWVNGQSNDTLYGSDADAPTWTHMDKGKLLRRQTWLIHFSDSAYYVWKEGFKHGIDDYQRLGLTTHYTDSAKKRGGYNFAFEIGNERDIASGSQKYGSGAVMFQSAGVEAYHYGDEEHQVIFYGKHVKPSSIIYLYQEDGLWHVCAARGSGNRGWLYRHEDINNVTGWVAENFGQYRRAMTGESLAESIIAEAGAPGMARSSAGAARARRSSRG